MVKSIFRAVMALLCIWQVGAGAAMAQQAPADARDDQRDGTIKAVQGEVTLVRDTIRQRGFNEPNNRRVEIQVR